MIIELTLKHKTIMRNGMLLNVAQTVMLKGIFLEYFKKNPNLILSDTVVKVVDKLHSKDKYEILSIDAYRKERKHAKETEFIGTSTDNIQMNYNNKFVTNIINSYG